MANLAKTFKDEIRRISRREIGLVLSNFRRDHTALKKKLAEQKSRIAIIEKVSKELIKNQTALSPDKLVGAGMESDAANVAVYARGIKSLRRRFGLTQKDLAILVGTHSVSVAQWEKKSGKISIRKQEVIKNLMELKGMKKAEVRERLGKPTSKRSPRKDAGKANK